MTTIKISAGDTEVIDIAIKRDGVAVDITTAALRFEAKRSSRDAGAALIVRTDAGGGGIVKTNAVGGLARITLSPANTASLDAPLRLAYGVQMTEANGVVSTVAEGLLYISADPVRGA